MRFPLPILLCVVTLASPAGAASRNFGIESFDRIRVDGPFKVKLTTGVPPFAKATGSSKGLDRVAIDVQGRTLVVRPEKATWSGYPGEEQGPVEISLGTHELSAAWINGAGSLKISKVEALTFDLSIQGTGMIGIDEADVDQLRVTANGTANVALAGRVGKLNATIRGLSNLDAERLAIKDAKISAEGPATVRANIANDATINASGVATIALAGNPTCITKLTGSASVSGCR